MRAAGLEPRADHETAFGYTAEQGRQALRALMQLDPRPTGVVVANVNAAVGLLAEAHALGIDVPRELTREQREAVDALSQAINGNPREALLRRAKVS